MPDAPPSIEAEIASLSQHLLERMAQLVLAGWTFTHPPRELWHASYKGVSVCWRHTLTECLDRALYVQAKHPDWLEQAHGANA